MHPKENMQESKKKKYKEEPKVSKKPNLKDHHLPGWFQQFF